MTKAKPKWQMFENVPAKYGIVPCETCGRPHNAYYVKGERNKRWGLAPQWNSPVDGHPYRPEDADTVILRVAQAFGLPIAEPGVPLPAPPSKS